MVAPVAPVRAVGLADAGLGRIVAAVGADAAHKSTQSLHLHYHVEACFEQEVKPGHTVAFEGHAVSLSRTIRELDHNTCPVLGLRGRRKAGHRSEAENRQEQYEDWDEAT